MTEPKDAVDYPYDWARPEDPDLAWEARKERLIAEYAQTHGSDPWQNGRYAMAGLVWGLITMVVLSLLVGW